LATLVATLKLVDVRQALALASNIGNRGKVANVFGNLEGMPEEEWL
jgi:hypothetical protein